MPRKLVNVKGHLLGVDDRTGRYFEVEVKDVAYKSIPEEEMTTLIKAISNGSAIVWNDPPESEKSDDE